jgi:cytosine/adenosine deaminase-related metal-dependent hydrolase
MGDSLLQWLKKYIWRWEGELTPETARVCSEVLYLQLLRCGATTFSDYTSVKHTDEAFKVAERFGLRGLIGKTLMDRNSPPELEEDTDVALRDSERLIRRWDNKGNGRLKYALTPRFGITCTDELLLGAKALSKKHKVKIQTHAHETKNEVKADRKNYGTTAIKHFNKLGLLGKDTILTHCVWLDNAEMDLLAKTKTGVVHCPGSNMLLASGVADVPKMLKKGLQVGLGSDVAAYYNVSPFEQMRLACLLQKVVHTDPHALDMDDAFRMATKMGSGVLGFKESDSLAKGKKADMVLLSTDRLAFSPLNDPMAQIIYSAYPSAVYEMIVDGKVLMKEREVLVADEKEILDKGNEVLSAF